MAERTLHLSWEHGVLYSMSQAVGQKTIKTQCERRVSLAHATPDADAVTCPECIEVYLDFQIAAEDLAREIGREDLIGKISHETSAPKNPEWEGAA